MQLPDGVRLIALEMHRDGRGSLTEIFRSEWPTGIAPCQWNVTRSNRNVLRGVHVHPYHADYLVLVQGRMTVGLYDLRRNAATHRLSALFEMTEERISALFVPPGVMHGFYFHEHTTYFYGVDAYSDANDELGCHWADPRLGLAWPCAVPQVSPRDRDAGSLAALEARFERLNLAFA